ncbi:HNH endonuclease [Weissella fangxianensis]|uniref:HNH endonuclease n=1 Tax=Weissella fangxianensis TaxID=2953879 RepID=UPI002158765D|nr:HNH endonuclease signature motif containing protein [Weissella fangxianensis]
MFDKLEFPKLSLSEVTVLIENSTRRKYQYVRKFLEEDTQSEYLQYEKNYPTSYSDAKNITRLTSINGLSKADAIKIYENRFTQSGARDYFNAQLSGICTICGAQIAGQLDHVLPKSQFPQYVVTPLNLVPICASCNSKKGDVIGFNPYYQDESNLSGLSFSFNFKDPTNFIFLNIDHNSDLEEFMEIYDIRNLISIYAADKIKAILRIVNLTNITSIEKFKDLLENGRSDISTNPKWAKVLFTDLLSADGKPEELFNNRLLFNNA